MSLYYILLFAVLATAASSVSQKDTLTFSDWLGRYRYYPMAIAAYNNPTNCLAANFPDIQTHVNYTADCDILGWDMPGITCFSYMAFWPTNNSYIVSFRGSLDIQIPEEENATLTYQPVNMPGGFGKVNYYFYHSFFDKLWPKMQADVEAALNTNANFIVVGHSLGGALASVFSYYIAQNYNFPSNRIALVTFGQPRTGDENFAAYVTSHVGIRYRVVNDGDYVPHSIPQNFAGEGYEHFGNEIWYHNPMGVGDTPVQCNDGESSSCSDSLCLIEFPPCNNYDLFDHLNYYDILLTTYFLNSCKYPTEGKCPADWTATDFAFDNCFAIVPQTQDWSDANTYCSTLQHSSGLATLLSIHNAFENRFYNQKANQAASSGCDTLYFGLYNDQGTWKYIDGSLYNGNAVGGYQNWGFGFDPNSANARNKCAYMNKQFAVWEYDDCSITRCFMCGLVL